MQESGRLRVAQNLANSPGEVRQSESFASNLVMSTLEPMLTEQEIHGSLHGLDPDQPVGTRPVLHDDAAVEQLAHPLRQHSAQRIASTAGRERKDDFG